MTPRSAGAVGPSTPLLEAAARQGWQTALFDYLRTGAAAGRAAPEDDRLADWRYLVPLDRASAALVLGCGWGTVPVALAELAGAVWAVDRDPEKTAFLRLRAGQQGLDHLAAWDADTWARRPPDRRLDLIAIGPGHPLTGAAATPRGLVAFARRRLRPGGTLQISGDNALSLARLIGAAGERSDLPRLTLGGFRRLLAAAGFVETQVYAPLPRHTGIPMFYIPADDPRAWDYFFRDLFGLFERVAPEVRQAYARPYRIARLGVRAALAARVAGLARFVVPGYLILARQADDPGHAADAR